MKNLEKIGQIWNEKLLKKTVRDTMKMITAKRINPSLVMVLSLLETNISQAPQAKTTKRRPASIRQANITHQANIIHRANTIPQANIILQVNTPRAPNTTAAETKTGTVHPVRKVQVVTLNRPVLRRKIVIRVHHLNVAAMKAQIGISLKNLRSKAAEACVSSV